MEGNAGLLDWDNAVVVCRREAERLMRDRAEAQDVAQDAVARAWRARDSCQTPEAPDGWLRSITRNEVLRSFGRGRDEPVDVTQLALADPQREEELAAVPARLDVRSAVRGLSEDDRRLLYLRYAEDLTQEAVARELGLAEGTAKIRLHRLRLKLRDRLES